MLTIRQPVDSRRDGSMNVLLTCAGRRNYLLGYFRQALKGRGRVLAADSSRDAPALQEADTAVVVPPVSDEGYVDTLLEVCLREKVALLVSLNDLELPVLAGAREAFLAAGTFPLVSSPAVIDLCFDKWRTTEFLRSIDLASPATYRSMLEAESAVASGDLAFPVVVKPRHGSASIGIEVVEDLEELRMVCSLASRRAERRSAAPSSGGRSDEMLIQECLQGQEFGIDIVNSLSGETAAVFVKQKLAMRAGETDRARTVGHRAIEDLGFRIGRELRHVGNLDCDVFETNRGIVVLELNPRFGGGYPFSHAAGANIPAALLAWLVGEAPLPEWLAVTPGVTAAKCDRLVVKRIG